LKIESQLLDDHQIKLIVETSQESFEIVKQRAARKLSHRSKIPGFRPGKAPYAIILRQLGEGIILEEALELYIQELYPKVIEEAKIEPYGPGELEKVVSYSPPKFEFVIPLKPVIKLGDYRSIRIPYSIKTISEEEVEGVIQNLRERQAIIEPANRPANDGDVVYIRISGVRKQSIENEEETELLSERTTPVIVRDSDLDDSHEWPFPEFSKQLIGMAPNERKIISYKFPEDFYIDTLKSAQAEYKVQIEEVKSRNLPEVNDEFAQSLGEYADLVALKKSIRDELEHTELSAYEEDYDNQVLEEVIKRSSIKYPPQMFNKEKEIVLERLKERLARQKQDIDLYLKTREITMDQLMEEINPIAESRLKKTLVLLEISEAESIKIGEEELQAETTKTMDELTPIMAKNKIPKMTEKEMVSNLVGNIMMDMVVKRATERIREIAKGEAIEVKQNALESDNNSLQENQVEIPVESGNEGSTE
jgi:trigger factor